MFMTEATEVEINDILLPPISEISVAIAYSLARTNELDLISNDSELNQSVTDHFKSSDIGCFSIKSRDVLQPFSKKIAQRLANDIEAGVIKARQERRDFDGKIALSKTAVMASVLTTWLNIYSLDRYPIDPLSDLLLLPKKLSRQAERARKHSIKTMYHDHGGYAPINKWFDWSIDDICEDEEEALKIDMPDVDLELLFENQHLRIALSEMDKSSSLSPSEAEANVKIHGNSLRFSTQRQEVIGAALSCLAQFPEHCTNSQGKIVVSQLADIVSAKAPLFWRETGEPPLSDRNIRTLLSKWVKKAAQ